MTDFYLVRNTIGTIAESVTLANEDSDNPATNLVMGSRSTTADRTANSTSYLPYYSLASGTTSEPDVMVIARLDMAFAIGGDSSTTVRIRGASDSGFTSDVVSDSGSVSESDLVGPESEDYVLDDLTGLAARRYWEGGFHGATSKQYRASKLFIGNKFDFGRNPQLPVALEAVESKPHGRRSKLRVGLSWSGVTAAKAQSFKSLFWDSRRREQFFLYDKSDNVLDGVRLLHVYLESAQLVPTREGVWNASATFREV